jgi:DNA recombination protein RmuC
VDSVVVLLGAIALVFLGIGFGYFLGSRGTRSSGVPELESGLTSLSDAIDRIATSVSAQQISSAQSSAALRIELTRSLANQSESLLRSVAEVRTQAQQLSSVLSRSGARGQWGEMELTRLVEAAGMINRVHFLNQNTIDSAQGRLRPDLQVMLSNGRCILIDAKTPMDSFLRSAGNQSEERIDALMSAHAEAVIRHIEQLGRKAYNSEVSESVDFVVMFLPSESLLEAALHQRPDLLDFAFTRNIVPATPTTLFALLRAVSLGWQNSDMVEQAQDIARLSQEMYSRLDVVLGHIASLGKSLGAAVGHYNGAVRSIETRLRPTGRALTDLGVRGVKNESELSATPSLEVLASELPESD